MGGVWSALWVIKRKQRELIALAANLILLIYAFNCALCILHCALSNDDFRGFGALTADVEAGNEVVAVDAHAVEVVEFDGSIFVINDDFGYARVVDGDVLFAVEADALVFEEVFGCCFVMGDDRAEVENRVGVVVAFVDIPADVADESFDGCFMSFGCQGSGDTADGDVLVFNRSFLGSVVNVDSDGIVPTAAESVVDCDFLAVADCVDDSLLFVVCVDYAVAVDVAGPVFHFAVAEVEARVDADFHPAYKFAIDVICDIAPDVVGDDFGDFAVVELEGAGERTVAVGLIFTVNVVYSCEIDVETGVVIVVWINIIDAGEARRNRNRAGVFVNVAFDDGVEKEEVADVDVALFFGEVVFDNHRLLIAVAERLVAVFGVGDGAVILERIASHDLLVEVGDLEWIF